MKRYNVKRSIVKIEKALCDSYPEYAEAVENAHGNYINREAAIYMWVCNFTNPERAKISNKLVNYLLELNDEDINAFVWRLSGVVDLNKLEGKLKDFAEEREKCKDNYDNYIGFHQTPTIKFSKGTLSVMTDEESDIVNSFLFEEQSNIHEYGHLIIAVSSHDHEERLSFTICNKKNEVVGFAALYHLYLCPERTHYTYDLCFYVLPKYRNQGYAKSALMALINKAFNKKLIYAREDDMFDYKYIPMPVDIRCLQVWTSTENVECIKLLQHFDFTNQGTLLVVNHDGSVSSNYNFTLLNPKRTKVGAPCLLQ